MNKKDAAIIAGPIVGAAAFFALQIAVGKVVQLREKRAAKKALQTEQENSSK